jgi:hypothetical protein
LDVLSVVKLCWDFILWVLWKYFQNFSWLRTLKSKIINNFKISRTMIGFTSHRSLLSFQTQIVAGERHNLPQILTSFRLKPRQV